VTAREGLARKRLQLASEIYRARVSPPSPEGWPRVLGFPMEEPLRRLCVSKDMTLECNTRRALTTIHALDRADGLKVQFDSDYSGGTALQILFLVSKSWDLSQEQDTTNVRLMKNSSR
jgi:hypothetical protein